MSKKSKPTPQEEEVLHTPQAEETAPPPEAEVEVDQAPPPTEDWQEKLAAQEEQYLRLAAEYDNFRKRSAKEKEGIWAEAKGSTILALLPVYDNLERAMKLPCGDEAYAKGVDMTMTELKKILEQLGVTEIPALGEPFDPAFHNAVMHVEEEGAGESTIVEVFQTGFLNGDKVLRFSMVKVAN